MAPGGWDGAAWRLPGITSEERSHDTPEGRGSHLNRDWTSPPTSEDRPKDLPDVVGPRLRR